MLTDQLYDVAMQFKRTKLWRKLNDSQLFAIRHADGTIGYCSVMGMMGQHLAIAVYPGDAGMDSLRLVGKDRSAMNELQLREALLCQNCVMCSFVGKEELHPRQLEEARSYCKARQLTLRGRNAYPQLQRFRPHYHPWFVDDEADQAHLYEALEAGMEVSAKLENARPEALGFMEGAPFDRSIPLLEKRSGTFQWGTIALPEPVPVVYPSPQSHDDILLASIKKSRKRGGEWACDVIMHAQPMTNEEAAKESGCEPKAAPFYPYLLLIVNNQSGMVISAKLSASPDEYADVCMRALLELAQKNGKPSRMLVSNERSRALFVNLARQLGAELAMEETIPVLEEVEQSFAEHFRNDREPEGELDQLIEMLQDPGALAGMPDEVLRQIVKTIMMDDVPKEIAENIKRECEKRGL